MPVVQNFEGTANTLCTNPESDLVCVAGRGLFRIYKIFEDRFEEHVNLKNSAAGLERRLNLNFSDVAWSPVEDHILVSAATNGTVVIWDLNRTAKTKHDFHYGEHRRTVHRVEIHPTDGNLILTGSQDNSMKIFDRRSRGVKHVFCSSSDAVRDVQFNPNQPFKFAAALESGNIQVWDFRNPDKPELHIQCHHGPIFSINWHPEERDRLATAGRDKFIKVWDVFANARPSVPYDSIQTIGPVAHVKWRPGHKYHIASCCLLYDCNINVWDIRRPFIPFAQFGQHNDVARGMVWKKRDPRSFLSCGKDNLLVQHTFNDATHPAKHANPVGLAIDIRGNIALARSDKRIESLSSSYAASLTASSNQEICVLNSDLCPPNVSQQQPVNMLHSKNFPTPTTTVFSRGNLVSNAKRQMSLHLSAAAPSSAGATLPNTSFHAPMPLIPSASNSVTGSPTNNALSSYSSAQHQSSISHHQSAMHNLSIVGAGIVSSTVSAFIPSNTNNPVPSNKMRPNIFTTFGVPKSPAKWSELFVKDKQSSLVVFQDVQGKNRLSMDGFVEFARRYKLAGASFEDLCHHNAQVADELRQTQIAATWRIMSVFFWRHPNCPGGVGGATAPGGLRNGVDNGVAVNGGHAPGSASSLSGFVSGSGSANLSRTTSNVSNLPPLDIKLALSSYVDDGGGGGVVQSPTPKAMANGEVNIFANSLSAASSNTDARALQQHQQQHLQQQLQQDEASNLGVSDDESEDAEAGSDQEKNLTSIASGQGLVSLNSDLFYDPADFYQALHSLKIKKDSANQQQKQLAESPRERSSTLFDPENDEDEEEEEESWRESSKMEEGDKSANSDWILPSEAIDPRQDIMEKSASSSPAFPTLIPDSALNGGEDGRGVGGGDTADPTTASEDSMHANAKAEGKEGISAQFEGSKDKSRSLEKANNKKNVKYPREKHSNKNMDGGLNKRLEHVRNPRDEGNSTTLLTSGIWSGNPGTTSTTPTSTAAPSKREPTLNIPLSSDAYFTPDYWDGSEMLMKMLHFYADHGDIQMTVSCLLTLEDKVKGLVDPLLAETWISGYVDLLRRFRLWTIATEVLHLAAPYMMMSPETTSLSQQSTLIRTSCGSCGRCLNERGWACGSCNALTNVCCFCHQVVKGLYVWCQGCSHGGHLEHLSQWFKKSKYCPTGCGHACHE